MASTFRCTIVTPADSVLDEEVRYASLPAWDGQKGVMTGSSPFLVQLGVGPLRLDMQGGSAKWFYLDGGVAQMQNNSLTLLTDRAIPAEKINVSAAEAELSEARSKIGSPGVDIEAATRQHHRAMAMISTARHG